MTLAVIDYGAGNLPNVVRALRHIGTPLTVTNDPAVVAAAPAIVLPGVGATQDTMDSLHRLGLVEPIRDAIRRDVPFLGICVGMQVLLRDSLEFGHHECLGVVGGTVSRFVDSPERKVPQIGWNEVFPTAAHREHPLWEGIPAGTDFYFVHSYYCAVTDPSIVAATTSYGIDFASVLIRKRMIAAQFHPEKSGAMGLRLLQNFVTHVAAIECEPQHV